MATWVYKCTECDTTFAREVENGAAVPEEATCPQCGDKQAKKRFELPTSSGGCGCGGGSCC